MNENEKRCVYVMRPQNAYGTERDRQLLASIARTFPKFAVVDPAERKHQEACKRLKADTGDGMPYFEQLAASCDMCVYLPFPDGMIGAGVWREVAAMLQLGHAVFEAREDSFCLVLALDENHCLNVEETRARICGPWM